MVIAIRHAALEDAHEIAEAEREIAKDPGFFCSQPFELTDQNVEHTITGFLKYKNGIYLVAECKNEIVGHAFLEQLYLQSLRHVAELTVVVHKDWQEKGIGTKLMESLVEWAKDSGQIEKIELNVRATNHRAIALYKKMGFHEEGYRQKRVKLGGNQYIDDVLMALFLN
jgi:RimJ/RimL family protein N-acetyltransferase